MQRWEGLERAGAFAYARKRWPTLDAAVVYRSHQQGQLCATVVACYVPVIQWVAVVVVAVRWPCLLSTKTREDGAGCCNGRDETSLRLSER